MLGKSDDKQRERPEACFVRLYQVTEITSDILVSSLDSARETLALCAALPRGSTIRDFEIFTRAPFSSAQRDREFAAFHEACLHAMGFVALVAGAVCRGDSLTPFSDRVREKLFDDWENCSRCPELQDVMRAAFGLGSGDNELLDRSFNGEVLAFLADSVLLQSSVCESEVLQLILERVGHLFVFQAIASYPQRVRRLIDNERKGVTDEGAGNGDFRAFLRLVACISGLRCGSDFADKFIEEGNDFLHSASEFVSPALFCGYLQTLAALCRSKPLAENVLRRLDESISDIMNLQNCILSIKGHAEDFNTYEVSQGYLGRDDVEGLESVLILVRSMFFESDECRHRIADDQDFNLVDSLFQLILSPVPASLKARCFDALSALTMDETRCQDLWERLNSCQILTEDFVERGKGGILDDIENIEKEERYYPLARSFVRFLSFLLRHKQVPVDFEFYHQFLFEQCLLKVRKRNYEHFHEKWALVSEICQCWTNFSLQSFEDNVCFHRTALCDSRFATELVILSCDEEAPQETLLCIYRLLLLVSQHEEEFRKYMDVGDQSSYVPMTTRLSCESRFLVKLVHCISSRDQDLQIICIDLTQFLASRAGRISQLVFSRSKAIRIFRSCIRVDESEEDLERNVRNKILALLSSLGKSSYFVRCVCGFDMSDVPRSFLRSSSLDRGIIPDILAKLHKTEASKNYPHFAARCFEFLLTVCDETCTCTPVMNFLRSSTHSFFNNQLTMLEDRHSLPRAIGCYLQLIAREATESEGTSHHATTLMTFRLLFGTQGFREHRSHVVLVLEFLDRIGSSDDGTCIAQGIYECCVAYGSNRNIRGLLMEHGEWRTSLCQFILGCLGKARNLFNNQATSYLTKACAYVGDLLFVSQVTGRVSAQDSARIFSETLVTLHRLYELNNTEARFGLYSLLTSIKMTPVGDAFRESEKFFSAAIFDLESSKPVMRASVFSAAQSILDLVDPARFVEFIRASVDVLQLNWELFDHDQRSGAFVLHSQFNFWNCLILHENTAFGRELLDMCVVDRLCHDRFWNLLNRYYSTSVTSSLSESVLEMASQCLRIICNFGALFGDREDLHRQTRELFLNYHSVLRSLCNTGGLFTLIALKFLDVLFSCYVLCPWLRESDALHVRDTFVQMVQFLRSRVDDDLRERSNAQDVSVSNATRAEANEILSRFRSYLKILSGEK